MVWLGVVAASDGSVPRGGRFHRERARILVRLIEDRFLFAESLAAAVHASAPDILVEHRSSRDVLADPSGVAQDAAVILVGLGRGSLTEGEAGKALQALLALDPHPPIAVVVQKARQPLLRQALGLGVRGFLPVSAPLSAAIGAIRLIRSGGTYLPDT